MDVDVMVLLVASMGAQPEAPLQHMTPGTDAGNGRVVTFTFVHHHPLYV